MNHILETRWPLASRLTDAVEKACSLDVYGSMLRQNDFGPLQTAFVSHVSVRAYSIVPLLALALRTTPASLHHVAARQHIDTLHITTLFYSVVITHLCHHHHMATC